MKRKEIVKVILDWQNYLLGTEGISRYLEEELYSSIGSKPIKVVTGFRRCGKSFLVCKIAKQLIDQNRFKLNNVLYLNFEEYKLKSITSAEALGDLFQVFLEDVVDREKRSKLLVFDEIQNVTDWDKFIRTIYERYPDCEIIITGSNSELLSSELGSRLAGRFIEFTLFPFSFREFLLYHRQLPATDADFMRHSSNYYSLFNEYLKYGGLPEVFDIKNPSTKISYLKGIITKVILDDIVKRFSIENISMLESILAFLLASPGLIISFAKIKRNIDNLGIKTSAETVITYVDYLKKTFAISDLLKFSWKQNKYFNNSKKYYAVDSGLLSIYRDTHENYAYCLENIIFIELKRRGQKIYYGTNDTGKEIDFLTGGKKKKWKKYQITANLTEENKKRELSSFGLSDKYMEPGENILLSLDDFDSESLNYINSEIKTFNMLLWLLKLI